MSDYLLTGEEAFDGFLDWAHRGEANLVVLFTAPTWCQPCKRFEPHWMRAHEHPLEGFLFGKVDMGESPEDTGMHWATARFGIRGVPQVKLFLRDGDIVDIKSRAVVPFLNEVKQYG